MYRPKPIRCGFQRVEGGFSDNSGGDEFVSQPGQLEFNQRGHSLSESESYCCAGYAISISADLKLLSSLRGFKQVGQLEATIMLLLLLAA